MLEIIIKENGKEILHAEDVLMYMASIQHANGETQQTLHKDNAEFEKLGMVNGVATFMAMLTGTYRLMDTVFEESPYTKEIFQEWVESNDYQRASVRFAEDA